MVYLASQSPRREQLLKKIVKDFKIVVPDVTEQEQSSKLTPKQLALYNARIKAENVYKKTGGFVIAADTVVAIGNDLLFKPQNQQEAYKMLFSLSGKTHRVITGVYVIGVTANQAAVTSYVTFNRLDRQFIDSYIKSGKCYDKAGGYGIQDSSEFAKKLSGSKCNVIGLPIKTVKRLLELSGYKNFN
ncbi:MAG: Maf family protein [Clostridia bacterium]|nr:Maf family protein [Clostridia bacterium]